MSTTGVDTSKWWFTKYMLRMIGYYVGVWWHVVKGHRVVNGSFEDSDWWECETCKEKRK